MSRHERLLLDGPGGKLEVFVEPHEAATGIALIAHPHPLFGGTADNKVVTTLAKAFRDLGCATLRPSFRGVGGSEGMHDRGIAETDDLLAVHDYARARFGAALPVYLAGFSFGAYVSTRLAKRLADAGTPARRLVLVGTAAGFIEEPSERGAVPSASAEGATAEAADATAILHSDGSIPLAGATPPPTAGPPPLRAVARQYETEAVAPDTIVIHGSADETVPLANVLKWAEPLELAVSVIPGADHFFHRKLHIIRRIVEAAWRP